jgi:hypothetical protein
MTDLGSLGVKIIVASYHNIEALIESSWRHIPIQEGKGKCMQ